LAELLKLPVVTSQPTIQFNFEQLAFKTDSAQGNFRSAMTHLKKATSVQLAVMKINSDRQIGRLQMEFETNKKDQDIEFKARHIDLLTRQNDLQKSSLKYQKLVRNLLIAGAALLTLLLAISYNRYKIKKMANHELEEQQEEINTQNESLRLLLIERDWLLKEVHHRVKNNLQIVISLLNSQLNNIKDAVAKDVIRESQHRMHSISLIHQRLYQDDDTAGINMRAYISDLTNYLQDSFGTLEKTIIQIDVEPLTLDVSQAVPLGLILNETVTNAIKYAYTAACLKPHLRILLKKIDERTVELVIADNGKGLPPDFEPAHSGSLGMKLITGLTKQLKGRISFSNQNGLCIKINIPLTPAFADKTNRKVEYLQ
jgi:two-component sensor histidine kinase